MGEYEEMCLISHAWAHNYLWIETKVLAEIFCTTRIYEKQTDLADKKLALHNNFEQFWR